MTSHPRRFTPRACALAATLVAGLLPCAYAETGPWTIGARQTFTHDSNVYRTPEATSDWISSTGIFGGFDQQISRQRVYGKLSADWNRYRDEERLNYNNGAGLLHLDWETIGNVSGDAQISHSQQLYRDYLTVDQAANKTIVRTTDGYFNARLGVVTAWTVEAGAFGSRTRFDGTVSNTNDIDYNGWRVGLRYNPRSHISVGIAGRRADGEYPKAGGAFDFTREDIDLLLNWRPTGTSVFDARLSRSHWDYESGRTNSLTTGSLNYGYRPGGRLTLDANFRRDNTAGQYNTDTLAIVGDTIEVVNAQTVNTRLTNTYSLTGNYQLTGKTALSATLQRIDRRLDDVVTSPTSSATATGRDRAYAASLRASWDPLRTVRVGCGYSRVKRTVEGASQFTYPYSVNLYDCSAQISLQP